ncbi:uncharacterized protein LAESUDRAFT_732682, partial [Laetiporus sulphureus 93-53]
HVAQGARADGKHDATETHVETAMWQTARPAMRALSDIVDTWERFAKCVPSLRHRRVSHFRAAGHHAFGAL